MALNQGMPLNLFAAELERQAQTKKDFLANAKALSVFMETSVLDAVANMNTINLDAIMAETGDRTSDRTVPLTPAQRLLLNMGPLGNFPMTELFHRQMAEYLQIPKPYYDRMRSTLPNLLTENINSWLAYKGEDRLIRTLDGNARAVLSPRYRCLDNFDLVTAILPPLQENGARIISQSITENKLYIKALHPSLKAEIKVGDIVEAGVLIENSETGMGRLLVCPFSYRLVCSNGMKHDVSGVKKTHLGGRINPTGDGEIPEEWLRDETREADDKALFMKVSDVVRASFNATRFEQIVDKMREAADRKIDTDPIKVVEVTAKRMLFSEAERTATLTALLTGNELTQWGLANAITATAGSLTDYDRSTELEKTGAQIVELPKRDWEALLKEASTTNAAAA